MFVDLLPKVSDFGEAFRRNSSHFGCSPAPMMNAEIQLLLIPTVAADSLFPPADADESCNFTLIRALPMPQAIRADACDAPGLVMPRQRQAQLMRMMLTAG